MVNPVNEDGAGLVAHPLGENSGKAILFKEGGDALEQEIFGLIAERPVELIFRLALLFRVKNGCAHNIDSLSGSARARACCRWCLANDILKYSCPSTKSNSARAPSLARGARALPGFKPLRSPRPRQ